MGLIADDHVDLSDQEMIDQLAMTLRTIDSDTDLTGKFIGGRNGPFGDIRLPIRQVAQIAYDTLYAKGFRSHIFY